MGLGGQSNSTHSTRAIINIALMVLPVPPFLQVLHHASAHVPGHPSHSQASLTSHLSSPLCPVTSPASLGDGELLAAELLLLLGGSRGRQGVKAGRGVARQGGVGAEAGLGVVCRGAAQPPSPEHHSPPVTMLGPSDIPPGPVALALTEPLQCQWLGPSTALVASDQNPHPLQVVACEAGAGALDSSIYTACWATPAHD